METEKLLIIAKGMGLRDIFIGDRDESIYFSYPLNCHITYYKMEVMQGGAKCYPEGIYNPLTNNDQNIKLEIELGITTSFIRKNLWQAQIGLAGEGGRGSTPNEARCNAAFEHFKK